jgi:hypothetical protein
MKINGLKNIWNEDDKTIERKICVNISLGHKKMKYRHNEPISRVNYLKEVSLEQKSLVNGKKVGRGFFFHWNFLQEGKAHN